MLVFAVLLTGCGNSEDKETIELSGTVETTNIIISSQVTGKIQEILIDEGEQVESGDTILIIEPDDYKIQLKQAKAQRDMAAAKFELLKYGARSEDIEQAEKAVVQAKANFESAQSDFERMANLYEKQSITKKQYEDASTRLKIAEAQYQSAQQNLQKVKNIIRPQELSQAKASLNAAEAQVELFKKRVNDCYIISSANGYITKLFIENSETVTPQTSLVKLTDLSEAEVTIYISETDLGRIKLGQKADVFTDTFPDKNYEGRVTYISPEAEFTPKNIQTKEERTKLVFAVKITLPNPEHELKAGMPVDAVIYL